jgi:putative Mg2+ transporter-C (MgtC) family protein
MDATAVSLGMIAPEAMPTWSEAMLRILAATAIGGAIGLNRELTKKPAGLRTHALVALGTALMTVTALQLGVSADDPTHADAASRVIQGVVAGIGFIGGGVILHSEGRDVKGLTTAATIWVAAALGISCGIGQWRIAGMTVGIALAVLVLGRYVETALHRHRQTDADASGH